MSAATNQTELVVSVHREGGSYWAEVRELPGCFATGDTLDELREALEEAISLYLTEDAEAGGRSEAAVEPVSRRVEVGEMRVLVDA
jgi:predicted RNase H-like HicB family nuclease